MKPIRKAVLPVAGFGTRVLPATKAIPKEMLPVFDRPAIQYVVDEAREAGISHFVFVTGRMKGAIEDYFDRAYELESTLNEKRKATILAEIARTQLPAGASSFVRQQNALGLGHAVLCARDIVGVDEFGIIHKTRAKGMDFMKRWVAGSTNPRQLTGDGPTQPAQRPATTGDRGAAGETQRPQHHS